MLGKINLMNYFQTKQSLTFRGWASSPTKGKKIPPKDLNG
jgi:hypothetical protein